MFKDRKEAGHRLSEALGDYHSDPQTVVIALPRGGVIVGAEIAKRLHLPLDIVVPRKIGAPFNPEFAIGAITETGEGIFSDEVIRDYGISQEYIRDAIEKEKSVAKKRLHLYRGDEPPRHLKGKTVLLVDDGIATGSTMMAAIVTLKNEGVSSIVVAVPVAPIDTLHRLEKLADRVVVLTTPTPFFAVGQFYDHFDQTTDEEVISLLQSKIKK